MHQEEYEAAIAKARETVLSGIEGIDEAFEEMKEELYLERRIKMLEALLKMLLLVAHTEQGRSLFLKVLEFSSKLDTEIAIKYWNEFDDIENLVKKRYFNITIQ